jgi:curli biogenesis system outer membrane secretion channel CsgG
LRYTVAVAKFQNHSSYAGQFALADTFGAVLTDSLLQTKRFIVIGESDMRAAALAEQELSTGGQTARGEKAPVTGNLTPAQLLVKGEITNFQDGTAGSTGGIGIGGVRLGAASRTAEINAVIYFVDSTTGQVKASKKVVGKIKSSSKTIGLSKGLLDGDLGSFKQTNVGKAMDIAVDQAVAFCMAQLESLPWSGNVILLRDDKIYFNRGQREGVEVGQIFKVGTAEILRDPGTGEVLDNNFTETARIRVESVKEKLAICTISAGSGIEKGMAVAPIN